MPVLAAVAHLSSDPKERLRGLAVLASTPGITLGDLVAEDRLPFVLESDSHDQDRARWARVNDAPGIVHVELAFVDFSDLTLSPSGAAAEEH